MKFEALTDEQKASMKVKHYTLHLPATLSDEQILFIQGMAKSVMNNEPYTVVHEEGMRFLLRVAYLYRNTLKEFDESERWTDEFDMKLNKISREFKPILDWLTEQYRLDVSTFRRE